jgi:hypothetical protein
LLAHDRLTSFGFVVFAIMSTVVILLMQIINAKFSESVGNGLTRAREFGLERYRRMTKILLVEDSRFLRLAMERLCRVPAIS